MKAFLTGMFAGLFLLWAAMRIINDIEFDRNVGGFLKRAADANTVTLAEANLFDAVEYLKKNGFTSGYTSILWRTPDEDVGFWFENLKSSLEELHNVAPETTRLERTNILMKLRETLLDHGEKSTIITAPTGISVFPYNTIYALWGVVSFILAVVFLAVFLESVDLI